MAQMAVPELSLWGLLERIQEIERLKSDVAHPDEEQQSLIATEGAVKKAAAEQLATAASSGLSHKEKNIARTFLQAQLKAVSADAPSAAARKAKLNELLKGVEDAPPADDPVHVRKAREALRRIEKDFKEVHETYEKWEKGKARFKSVDELTSMKRSHDDLQKALDQAQRYLEAELQSRTGTGAAPPTVSAASKPKPKAVQTPSACPSSRSPPAKAPARSQQPRPPPPPSNEAARRAQMAAQFWEPVVEEEPDRPVAPKPKRAPKPAEPADPEPFLSYQCTVKAIAQVMGCSEKQAREVGASVSELREQFEVEAWKQVSELSVEIEKKQKEQEKEREKRRMEAALARKADEHGPSVVAAPVPAAARQAAAKAPPKQQPPKAKAKPKTAPPKSSSIAGLAHQNRFGNLDDDDDEGGWWTVQK
jgi:hypothetical protein